MWSRRETGGEIGEFRCLYLCVFSHLYVCFCLYLWASVYISKICVYMLMCDHMYMYVWMMYNDVWMYQCVFMTVLFCALVWVCVLCMCIMLIIGWWIKGKSVVWHFSCSLEQLISELHYMGVLWFFLSLMVTEIVCLFSTTWVHLKPSV